MIRLLNVLGMAAAAVAVVVVVHCVGLWQEGDSGDSVLRAELNVAEQGNKVSTPRERTDGPLVAAAKVFASVLNPPAAPAPATPPPVVRDTPVHVEPVPVPVMESPKFRVFGTSCSDSHPERSMALIAEIGQEGEAQWVREGTVLGHFTIHEIRDGVVVCLAGERRCELAVEQHLPTFSMAEEGRFASVGMPGGAIGGTPAKTSTPGPLRRPGVASGPRVGSARSAAIE